MKIRHREIGSIVEFSRNRSRLRRLQKRVKAWADIVEPFRQTNEETARLVMVTLTYADADDWRANDIRSFMLRVRTELGAGLLAYAWVAELQRRGAVHYHVLLLTKRAIRIPKPDEAGWWEKGMTRIETAQSPYYAVKYTGKEYQKIGSFPKGLRMFAVWIAAGVVSDVTRWFFRLSALPGWLVDSLRGLQVVGQSAKRVPGGGWSVAGTFYKSPWEVLEFG